jgi:hypothetical protein
MADATGNRGFDRVVALNEAAKGLLALSYQVNLLAIDAMLQSKRGGGDLRGFDEVSSQMRSWSRDLHERLERLSGHCSEVVGRTSLYCKQAHILQLLEAAARQSTGESLQAACGQRGDEQQALAAEVDRDWRRVRAQLDDLNQLGTMAVVLSRSAMIEASTGTAEQRLLLTQVSQEFSRHSNVAVQTIRDILKQLRED